MGVFRGYGAGNSAAAPTGQTATQTPYTNTTSGLAATDVQGAIDALDAAVDALASSAGGGSTVGLINNILSDSEYVNGGDLTCMTFNGLGTLGPITPGSTTNFQLSDAYLIPVSVIRNITFSRMAAKLNTLYTPGTSQFRYIIWVERSATDKRPGTIVFDTGAFTVPAWDGTGGQATSFIWRNFSTTFTFEKGKQYWVGIVATGGSAVIQGLTGAFDSGMAWSISNATGSAYCRRVLSANIGNNPSFSATLGNSSSDHGNGFAPVFHFQT